MKFNLTLLILLLSSGVKAQFEVQQFSMEDGLRSNKINEIIQTDDGYVWMVNGGQICRFDGQEFRFYRDTTSLKLLEGSHYMFDISLVGNDLVFVGHDNIYRFNQGNFTSYPTMTAEQIDKWSPGATSMSELDFERIDRYGQSLHKSNGKYLFTERGFIETDWNLEGTLHTNFLDEYTRFTGDTLYVLKEGGKIERHWLPHAFSSGDQVNQLGDQIIALDRKGWGKQIDTIFFIEDSKVQRKVAIPVLEPNLASEHQWTCQELQDGYYQYYGGVFITPETTFVDTSLSKLTTPHIISKTEVIFYSSKFGLVYKNFETNQIIFSECLPPEIRWGFEVPLKLYSLKSGTVLLASAQGFYLLNRSNQMWSADLTKQLVYDFPDYEITNFARKGADQTLIMGQGKRTEEELEDVFNPFKELTGHMILLEDGKAMRMEKYDKHIDGSNNMGWLGARSDEERVFKTDTGLLKLPDVGSRIEFTFFTSDSVVMYEGYGKATRHVYSLLDGSLKSYDRDTPYDFTYGAKLFWEEYFVGLKWIDSEPHLYKTHLPSGEVDYVVLDSSWFIPKSSVPFFADSESTIWLFGRDWNLISVDANSMTAKNHGKLVPGHDQLQSWRIAIDKNDCLWVLNEKGLHVINLRGPELLYTIIEKPILPAAELSMVPDSKGNMIVLNDQGIFWARAEDIVSDSPPRFTTIKWYRDNETVYKTGELFKNGDIGLRSFSGYTVGTIPVGFENYIGTNAPKIRLLSIKTDLSTVFGEKPFYGDADMQSLPNSFAHDENNLELKFTAMEFRNHDLLVYRYRIVSETENWTETDQSYVLLSNLQPDEYKLEVQSVYNDVPSESFYYEFEVRLPWWQTSWFYLIQAGFFLLLLILTFFLSRKGSSPLSSFLTILTILIFFEAVLMIVSSYIDALSHGIPIVKLVGNVTLAFALKPMDKFVENRLNKRRSARKEG